jgi:hypothetical protein
MGNAFLCCAQRARKSMLRTEEDRVGGKRETRDVGENEEERKDE